MDVEAQSFNIIEGTASLYLMERLVAPR